MTDTKESIDDEIFWRFPKACQILIEFARERGILEPKKESGGEKGASYQRPRGSDRR